MRFPCQHMRTRAAAAAAALMAAVCPLAPTIAQSGGPVSEIRGGIMAHDYEAALSRVRREDGIDGNIELLFRPLMHMLGGTIRPALGGTISFSGQTSFGYLDARWEIETASGIFLGLGLGIAVHNGHTALDRIDRKALGNRALFHIPLEIGWRFDRHNSVSIYAEHISNADLASANEGLDVIGVRYGYRF